MCVLQCKHKTIAQFVWEKKTFYVIPKGSHHSFYLLDLTRSKKIPVLPFLLNYITTERCAQSASCFALQEAVLQVIDKQV